MAITDWLFASYISYRLVNSKSRCMLGRKKEGQPNNTPVKEGKQKSSFIQGFGNSCSTVHM